MANDYSAMQVRIADEIADSGLTSEIKLAILSAIKHYAKERWYFTEQSTTFATVAGTQAYDLPTDFKAMDLVRVTYPSTTSFYHCTYKPFELLNRMTTVSTLLGPPQFYSTFAQQLWFWPIPADVYTITEYYWRELDTLVNDTDTNAWMVDGEELIRNRAKWDLYTNVIHEPDEAAPCKSAEMEAYEQLRGSSVDRTVRGRITPAYL